MANYYFTHQPTVSPDNLHQFDELDALTAQNGFILSLENRLQTKRKSGDAMKSVDLATFWISTDYQFRLNKNNTSYKQQKFDGVYMKLELIPYSWMYLTSDMKVNTKHSTLETASVDIVAHGEDKWSLGLSDRFEDTATTSTNLITLDGMYKINDKWKIRAYERFDTMARTFAEQEYTLSRDLHCWIVEFTYDLQNLNEQSFWLVFKLKAFPEYPVGLRRTYSRARFGEAGQR
jgi:hypothetical protein